MGTASSSSADATAADTAASANNSGFTSHEENFLASLRRLACIENDEKLSSKEMKSFVEILWTISRGEQLAPLAPTLSDASNNMEALIRKVKAQHQCQQMGALFSLFPSLNKLNVALGNIFKEDDDTFLETLSNILGDNDYSRNNTSTNILMNACKQSHDESIISAFDVIELCFDMASISHYLSQENNASPGQDDTDDNNNTIPTIMEMRNVSSENSIVQSMTNSLLENAKSYRDNRDFGVGYGSSIVKESTNSLPSIAEGCVTKAEFVEWQRKVMPDLLQCTVIRFLRLILFPQTISFAGQYQQQPAFPTVRNSNEITSQTTTKMRVQEILPLSSQIFGTNTSVLPNNASLTLLSPPIVAFASISMSKLGQLWYQIYDGSTNGWTFQSLENSILGYEGSTVLIIQAQTTDDGNKNNKETVTFGAYTSSKWEKNKRDHFGNSDCFLFQLYPTLRVMQSLPKVGSKGGRYMYFHSNTNVITNNPSRNDDMAIGLGFGGTARQPRLFVDCNLEYCTILNQCTSFEEGYLGPSPPSITDPFAASPASSSSSTLNIISLEVYAVGDDDAINRGFRAQRQHRDIADSTLRNARTVDRAAFVSYTILYASCDYALTYVLTIFFNFQLGDMQNGLIENKNFAHRDQVDGRASGYLKGEGKANGFGR